MPEILGDVRALAYVERWAHKEGVWAKSAFCGQKAKFAGQIFFIDRRVGYVAHPKRLALLHAKGQSEGPPPVRKHLIERDPLHRLRGIELGLRRPAKGLPALMLGGLLGGGKVRVALDRDRRVVDIRYDLGHRRGD